jgi:DNA-binding NarL/FixJ family response regulator
MPDDQQRRTGECPLNRRSRVTASRGSGPSGKSATLAGMGISVFVVDQERTFADALAARLEAEDDVEVVAAVHARTPAQCLIVGRHADVMLLDGDLPERAAMRLCEELCSRAEPPRVVMLSFSAEPERIVDAVRSGATAWVGKNESLQHLLEVIRGVARGETWLPPAEAGRVLELLMWDQEQRRGCSTRSPRASGRCWPAWRKARDARRWPSNCTCPPTPSARTCKT